MDSNEAVVAKNTSQEDDELIQAVEKRLDESTATYFSCSTNNSNDNSIKITNIYLCSLCLSPILHILDVATDAYLAYQYYLHGEDIYFKLTTILIIVPALISTLFSIQMYTRDTNRVSYLKWTFRCVLLMLQISPVIRYLEAFQHALNLRRNKDTPWRYVEHYTLLLKEDSNLALLRILECFLESAPQQVLQISILLTPGRPNMPPLLQIYLYSSLLTSFLSTSWTFVMYHRSIRFARQDKMKMNWFASFVQFTWIFFITSSRILAIGQAASIYPLETLAILFIHWLTMSIWLVVFEKSWFCSSNVDNKKLGKFKEVLFCASMGLVYIFSFVPVNDERTRYKYLFYYCVCFIENCLSIVLWILKFESHLNRWHLVLPFTIFFMFVIGITMMLIYYSFYHPSLCPQSEIMSLKNRNLLFIEVNKSNVNESTQTM